MPHGTKILDWEKDFIYLSYPLFKNPQIGKILGRTKQSIQSYAVDNNLKKAKIVSGDIFGYWTVIEETQIDETHWGWVCKCKCENVSIIRSDTLLDGKSQSCGCYGNKQTEYIPWWFYAACMRSAACRGINFEVSQDFLNDLYKKQECKCAITKLPLFIPKTDILHQKKNTAASLDRIDNNGGYTEDNVQFLFVDLNFIKGTYPQDYLIALAHLIAKNTDFIELPNLPKDFSRAGKNSGGKVKNRIRVRKRTKTKAI